MSSDVPFDVEEYASPRESCLPATPQAPLAPDRPGSYNWSRTVGLIGTLVLHCLVLRLFLRGEAALQTTPLPSREAGVSVVPPAPELELLVLSNNADGQDSAFAEQIASLQPSLQMQVLVPIPSTVDTVALPTNDEAAPSGAAGLGDAAERALMFGRYTGQIGARIERAWVWPRGSVMGDMPRGVGRSPNGRQASDLFTCRVQIRQDVAGNVNEVLLLACPASEEWRHSLVVAINQASPLPAPPIPSVFARALTITFEARAYHEGDQTFRYRAAISVPTVQ